MTKLIKTWEEFKGLESDTHKIEIEHNCCGWIIDKTSGKHEDYLSTHTFYKKSGIAGLGVLKRYGFDAEIVREDR